MFFGLLIVFVGNFCCRFTVVRQRVRRLYSTKVDRGKTATMKKCMYDQLCDVAEWLLSFDMATFSLVLFYVVK